MSVVGEVNGGIIWSEGGSRQLKSMDPIAFLSSLLSYLSLFSVCVCFLCLSLSVSVFCVFLCLIDRSTDSFFCFLLLLCFVFSPNPLLSINYQYALPFSSLISNLHKLPPKWFSLFPEMPLIFSPLSASSWGWDACYFFILRCQRKTQKTNIDRERKNRSTILSSYCKIYSLSGLDPSFVWSHW